MENTTAGLLEKIKGLHGKIIENETKHLNLIIELSRSLNELKKRSPRTWLKKLEKIGISQRVANRYLQIGANWSDDSHTPGSDLREKLPVDLHKLEQLARLPLEKLENLAQAIDLREESRGRVINAVQRMLGSESGKSGSEPDILKPLKKALQSSVERILEGAEDLGPEQRSQLAQEVEVKMTVLMEALLPADSTPAQEPVADDDSDEE